MHREKLLDLNEAIQFPGKVLSFELSTELEEEEDIDLLSSLHGTLSAVSNINMLTITGHFETSVVMECARCLQPVVVDLEFDINEEFPISGIPASMAKNSYAQIKTEAEFAPLFEGNSLIYEELLRQSLWLNLPSRQLCRSDCPGLPGIETPPEPIHSEFEEIYEILKKREQED